MHDPLVVAFEIRRPWPRRSSIPGGRRYWWPPLVTVWHREPGGHDSGEVCRHYIRYHDKRGEWRVRVLRGWRFHIHHWKVQVHPVQKLRRWALTRCAWCGGRSRKGDQVNHALSWYGPRGRWWQGEPGLYHGDCSAVERGHATCLCDVPVLEHRSHGRCVVCGRHRAFGMTTAGLEIARVLGAVPNGQRDPGAMRRVEAIAAVERDLPGGAR